MANKTIYINGDVEVVRVGAHRPLLIYQGKSLSAFVIEGATESVKEDNHLQAVTYSTKSTEGKDEQAKSSEVYHLAKM